MVPFIWLSALDTGQIEQISGKNILPEMADYGFLGLMPRGYALLKHSKR
jgi:hypothetical protein